MIMIFWDLVIDWCNKTVCGLEANKSHKMCADLQRYKSGKGHAVNFNTWLWDRSPMKSCTSHKDLRKLLRWVALVPRFAKSWIGYRIISPVFFNSVLCNKTHPVLLNIQQFPFRRTKTNRNKNTPLHELGYKTRKTGSFHLSYYSWLFL